MSAFDNIASAAARDEARVREVIMPTVSRLEIAVRPRHGIVAVLVLLAIGGAAYWEGRQDGSARYDAEHARFETYVADERTKAADEEIRQADALRDVQAASDLRAEQATAAATDLQGRIDAYVAQLSHRPVDARCTLTDADLRGLRDYAPGGAPARAHRRPTRPLTDAE